MSAQAERGGYLTKGLVLFAAWTVFGILSSAHFFFGYDKESGLSEFLYLADNVIVFYWGWAILTPVVLRVAARLSGSGMGRVQDWALAVMAAAGVMILHGVIHTTVVQVAGIDRHPGGYSLVEYLQRHGGGDLATFAVLVGGYLLYDANRRARAREVAASELSARLARADLELLRWNLHPHFLFNALNTVSTLVMKGDNENAGVAIEKISRFLRSGLAQRADSLVTVSHDVGVTARYVEIEALRFGGSLRLEVNLENGAGDACIPGSLLQPLVENAITHGAVRDSGSRPVRIHGTTEAGRLILSVTNDGASARIPSPDETIHESVDSARFGLRYVRERLRQFYGDDARFTLDSRNGEAVAVIDVPLLPRGP
jgi:two-component system LytT family sensor kinase